jgi:hypothetical protein
MPATDEYQPESRIYVKPGEDNSAPFVLPLLTYGIDTTLLTEGSIEPPAPGRHPPSIRKRGSGRWSAVRSDDPLPDVTHYGDQLRGGGFVPFSAVRRGWRNTAASNIFRRIRTCHADVAQQNSRSLDNQPFLFVFARFFSP